MRQRKQQHVAKENLFYMQLMQQALPAEAPPDPPMEQTQQSVAPSVAPATPNVQNNHKVHNHSHKVVHSNFYKCLVYIVKILGEKWSHTQWHNTKWCQPRDEISQKIVSGKDSGQHVNRSSRQSEHRPTHRTTK